MASKGPRSKLDHESRARRQKALEVPREPRRPKTHWDHVLEEMIWLSKDFEAERKWKLAQAKKVALRASRVDQETRGEKRMKEEEQRMRKVALNITKDVKKFWTKIEKLVLYKHQLERDYKKKKALDKQLEYLLGQTERYSTMLAENLLGTSNSGFSGQRFIEEKPCDSQPMEIDVKTMDGSMGLLAEAESNAEESTEAESSAEIEINATDADDDFDVSLEDKLEDDEQTIDEDEALITEEERQEELAALQNEKDLPLEELLKRYSVEGDEEVKNNDFAMESSTEAESDTEIESTEAESSAEIEIDAMGADDDFDVSLEDKLDDDEQTIDEDEALITEEERQEELAALQNEKDLPLEELLKRYSVEGDEEVKNNAFVVESSHGELGAREVIGDEAVKDNAFGMESSHGKLGTGEERCGVSVQSPEEVRPTKNDEINVLAEPKTVAGCSATYSRRRRGNNNGPSKTVSNDEALLSKRSPDCLLNSNFTDMDYDLNDEQADYEFVIATGEEKDDETTLEEEEELEKMESSKPEEEIALLQKESETPLEELLARYNKEISNLGSTDDESDNSSADSDVDNSPANQVLDEKAHDTVVAEDIVSEEVKDTLPAPGEESGVDCVTVPGEESQRDARIADAAAAARSAQPTGNTFSTNNVRTKFPFLIKYPLREYQHIGLDWLVTMYEKRLNGILADEMGLGKTIMTIALLAHLACEKGIWGPHLIVVPTSVMLNWETEFLKWCPAFKILTYFGSAKERKHKRQGWMKPNSFHVCITTYRLVIQDSKAFKRKKWKYLILDEAHLIKNWKSQRWQTLLNFNSKRRILLTGTPLQNDLMELWSLMHFLMPHIFQSHQEFKDWFCSPISGMVEGQEKVNKEVIDRLHNVLRPFILRRLKRDVEKQLPMKHEHVIYCKLSKRQRNLYEDFIASSETQATLASSNFLGMLSVIMQLRKVCNHPDLFEGRSIVSSFDMEGIEVQLSSAVCSILSPGLFSSTDLSGLGFLFTHLDFSMTSWEYDEVQSIATPRKLIESRVSQNNLEVVKPLFKHQNKIHGTNIFKEIQKAILEERLNEAKRRAEAISWWNSLRCRTKPVYSTTLRELLTIEDPIYHITRCKEDHVSYDYSSKLADIVLSPVERFQNMRDQIESFMFVIPAARAPPPVFWCNRSGSSVFIGPAYKEKCTQNLLPLLTPIRPAVVRRQLYFPDRRLIQFDCGKLQQLATLLRRLKTEGHRALIFTQMTKMLDVLEAFINLYGYTYMRLDGSTQPEERQTLMQRFNTNPKIFLFILSTRSGGVGINLVGADTVIFYDSDWNPAMDQQAQDRCHRIGQTREVHIYRLISESTIEENILKKANQKRALDDLVIQSGSYNTEFFKKLDPMELFSGHRLAPIKAIPQEKNADDGVEIPVSNADIEAALKNAEDEADYMALKKVEEEEAVDNQEFTEENIGKVDDEDLGNEDAIKADESAGQNDMVPASNIESMVAANDLDKEKALSLACEDEDEVDMIADVKQMAAAAAAAGQEVLSFENQLRPIDRYAMRFLEVWDPIIDKDAINQQVQFEEREWELERIEKLKEDMEAELDDDDEPLVYEKWDAEFATQAYHQQVEALAQHQLMEELESKAREKENLEDVNGERIRNESGSKTKPKKKKPKKAKFKSLKKHSLSSVPKVSKEDDPVYLSSDYEDMSQDADPSADLSPPSIILRLKRKKDETVSTEEETSKKMKFKKAKKTSLVTTLPSMDSDMLREELKDTRVCDDWALDLDLKPSSRGKMGGKISILTLPMKRVYTIRPEKWKKKGNVWSSDWFPLPDSWLPQEDAVLCALVHEYGPNWSLVSDFLYGMSAGGLYRGRFRHPYMCCERFRELFQKYVNAVVDTLNNEKANTAGPAKGLLKVTEDNVRVLLDAAIEQPDSELLLQRHFTALLTSVWRMTSSLDQQKKRSVSHDNLYPSIRLFGASVNPSTQNSTTSPYKKKFDLGQCGKLISLALHDAENVQRKEKTALSCQMEGDSPTVEKLDVTVEFRKEGEETDDSTFGFPSVMSLSIPGLDPLPTLKTSSEDNQLRFTKQVAENRFRASSSTCLHDVHGWASTTFPISESRNRLSLKSPLSGKHKLGPGEASKPSKSKVRKVAEPPEVPLPFVEPIFQLLPTITPDTTNPTSISYPSEIPNSSFEEHLMGPLCDVEEGSPSSDHEMVPHCYNPSFISDLDDCSLTEYTDIG